MPSEDDELVLVGHGPVATVYAGESDDTAFALKIYPGEVDRRSLRSVRAELATLAELRDRARILVADSVERRPGGTTALRMELCAQSLSELVEEAGRRPVDEAVALGEALAETLAAAHDRGIVHGGVSPGNVLFEGSGDALLSDFGTTLRRHSSAESTPHGAVAPETLRDGVLDRRSDLYGLGATLYFALTGHAPHPRVPGESDDRSGLRVLKDPVAPSIAPACLRLSRTSSHSCSRRTRPTAPAV